MKTNKILVAVLIASASLLNFSCKKNDVVSPAVTNPNTTPQGKIGISLSVQVTASSSNTRTAGLSGATVTIQSNGSSQTATTNESGIANFSSLNEGRVAIFVKGPAGFVSSNTTADLNYDGSIVVSGTSGNSGSTNNNTGTFVDVNSNNTVPVTLAALNAGVKGKIVADLDNNGISSEAVSGKTVVARVTSTIQPNVFTTTTGSDGTFTFVGLPEGTNISFSLLDLTTQVTNGNNVTSEKGWSIPANPNNVQSLSGAGGKVTQLGLIIAN